MKALLDTNVLTAALVKNHPHCPITEPWLVQAQKRELHLVLSAHNLAELYSALTSLPGVYRVPPPVAREIIQHAVVPFADVVTLDQADYMAAIQRAAEWALSGGIIYDALIARAAEKARVDKLVTFNVEHFRSVWPEGAARVTAP